MIYFDMDDVLCKFTEAFEALKTPKEKFPHHVRGFYNKVEPIYDAITAFKYLEMLGYDCRILTAPSPLNPETYTGKALWVRKHMGQPWVSKLIIASDKELLIGDYLLDDNTSGHGQDKFQGKFIHCKLGTNWVEVVEGIVARVF